MPSEVVVRVDASDMHRALAKLERDPEAYITDRRLQVLARLVEAASLTGPGAVTTRLRFIEATRTDYPDVFADLDRYQRACATLGG